VTNTYTRVCRIQYRNDVLHTTLGGNLRDVFLLRPGDVWNAVWFSEWGRLSDWHRLNPSSSLSESIQHSQYVISYMEISITGSAAVRVLRDQRLHWSVTPMVTGFV